MDFRRSILYFAVAILGVMLYHAWKSDYSPKPTAGVNAISAQVAHHPIEFAPTASSTSTSTGVITSPDYQASAKTLSAALPKNKMIVVQTDVLDAQINLRGGNLVEAKLVKYPISLKEKNQPVRLLNSDNDKLYIAQSGLSVASAKAGAGSILYNSAHSSYVLQNGQNNLVVTLTGKTAQGLVVQKTFTFIRGKYAVDTAMTLTNKGSQNWQGNIYNQITRRYVGVNGSFYTRSYDGASVATQGTPYKKLTFESLSESDFSRDIHGGWLAMQQHYFLTAWIPPKNQMLHYYSRSFGHGDDGKDNIFVLGYMSPSIQLAPNASTTFNSTFYVGPEIAKNLDKLAKGLGLTVDYGWLWPISKFLFWLMMKIHQYVGNWGWSIILVTVIIKLAFYWLSNKSYASMARTRDLQPKIKALKDRFGDDKQAMSKAMMEMYRKEKINPLGGCLPMIVQIPVFIALYYVLIESVELRQAPFIFWIHDLSMKDPYFILPVLMGLSMLLQQKLSPPPPDPAQAKMMMLLPVVFTVFFATFPAGLVLYWLTNNCVSILQQWIVMRTHQGKTRLIAKTKR
ncbi:MAG: membrane protein insertase YidC [Gammaproteobacteria bacterium CG_4_10_14_0_8_um_filter_38_16]|nr:MAG: membrane protein insertase YidC [Gammaproteobacteria bacterium CG_4_10_14_0_8_um_filter_38_16]PJA03274.1 MAG: membrane protein insertase YidC [Gammaproteobacteria bacterium CG_4_10_14_0_2_um_filter_38_22]PJB09824.1 MAG: membrane protein insertase YidC [Gammaproteobacteria bacterium CG_4_9_14_3_um_filter_38_9]